MCDKMYVFYFDMHNMTDLNVVFTKDMIEVSPARVKPWMFANEYVIKNQYPKMYLFDASASKISSNTYLDVAEEDAVYPEKPIALTRYTYRNGNVIMERFTYGKWLSGKWRVKAIDKAMDLFETIDHEEKKISVYQSVDVDLLCKIHRGSWKFSKILCKDGKEKALEWKKRREEEQESKYEKMRRLWREALEDDEMVYYNQTHNKVYYKGMAVKDGGFHTGMPLLDCNEEYFNQDVFTVRAGVIDILSNIKVTDPLKKYIVRKADEIRSGEFTKKDMKRALSVTGG